MSEIKNNSQIDNNPNLKKSVTEIIPEIDDLKCKINNLIFDFQKKYEYKIGLEISNEESEFKRIPCPIVIKASYDYLFFENDPSAFEVTQRKM